MRKIYTRNNSKDSLTSDLKQYWVNKTWVNKSYLPYTYDSNNNKISTIFLFGDNPTEIFEKEYYTYDANNNLPSQQSGYINYFSTWTAINKNFKYCNNNYKYYNSKASDNGVGVVWRRDSIIIFCKPGSTGIIEKGIDNFSVAIYPNPSNGHLNIKVKD